MAYIRNHSSPNPTILGVEIDLLIYKTLVLCMGGWHISDALYPPGKQYSHYYMSSHVLKKMIVQIFCIYRDKSCFYLEDRGGCESWGLCFKGAVGRGLWVEGVKGVIIYATSEGPILGHSLRRSTSVNSAWF